MGFFPALEGMYKLGFSGKEKSKLGLVLLITLSHSFSLKVHKISDDKIKHKWFMILLSLEKLKKQWLSCKWNENLSFEFLGNNKSMVE